MSHDHHGHCCEHKAVRYCRVCKAVYCLDCGKEWRNKIWYNACPPYPQWTYAACSNTMTAGLDTMAAVRTTGSCVHN